MKKNRMYKEKENGRVVYVLEETKEYNTIIVIMTEEFKTTRTTERIKKEKFEEEYEIFETLNKKEKETLLLYFQKVADLIEKEKEIKACQNSIENMIEENKEVFQKNYHRIYDKERERIFNFEGQKYYSKTELATAMGISTSMLNIYIDRNGYDHFYLTEEETKSITDKIASNENKKRIYKHGNIKCSGIDEFIFKLKISKNNYIKWCELGNNKKDLTNKEGVNSLIEFHEEEMKKRKPTAKRRVIKK